MVETVTDMESLKTELKSLCCSICHCIFSEPKILPCQHSFCRHCLKLYINTNTQKQCAEEKFVEFPCPLCQMTIKSTKNISSIEKWSDKFPTNFTLISITDELLSEKRRKERRPVCTVHRTKRVKFFCRDCNLLLCSLCTVKAHKTCPAVQTLSEAVSEIKNTNYQLCEQLIAKKDEVQEVSSQLKELRASMIINKKQTLREIQNQVEFIAKLLHELREREREVVRELENLYGAIQLDLGEALAKCESTIDSISACQNLIGQNAIEDVDEAAFLQGISAANRKFKELPESMPATPNRQVLIFQPNSYLQQQLQRLVKRPLGKVFLRQQQDPRDQLSDGNASVVPTEAGGTLTEMFADNTDSAVFLSKLSTIRNENKSIITDVELLPGDFLAVTDSTSCTVKIFSEEGEFVKEFQLQNSPWGVCCLGHGKIAVTVPSKRHIICLSYTEQSCVRWKLTTAKKYLGLVALNEGILVCASASNSCVDIISIHGDIYQSFNKIFVHPTYVALTKERNIIVTDSYNKSLICCDRRGQELFRYIGRKGQELTEPAGICTNRNGSIFVADVGNYNIYKIQHLSLLTNIQKLSLAGLAISPDNKLVLTHNSKNNVSGISMFHD